MAVGGMCGGGLNDLLIRLSGRRRFSRSAIGFTGKLLASALIALSVVVEEGRSAMLVLLGCKFFGDWSVPTVWGTVTDISGRATGTVFGATNMAGSLGAFVAGPTMGYVKQEYGWETLFLAISGVYLVASLLWLLIDCTRQLVVDQTEQDQIIRAQ